MQTTDETLALATQHGFISGARCGYSRPDLWVKDSDGGGRISVYLARGRWVVAFFGPGSDIPFAHRSFPGAEQAFRYATS